MRVELLNNTEVEHTAQAVVLCKANKMPKDEVGLVKRVGVNMKHGSILRHLKYTFSVEEITTKTLMALSRHQTGVDLTVQSTRYALQKVYPTYTQTKNDKLNKILHSHMEDVRELLTDTETYDNDDLSLLLPQAYHYNLIMTINGQALLHLLELRTPKSVHFDFRDFAYLLFDSLPESHKAIYEDVVYSDKKRVH